MSSTRTDRIIRTCLVSLLLFGLTGCGGGEKAGDPEAGRLLVIGIDSADWRLLNPMLDEGRLPNLRAFMEQSSHGRMKTFYPLKNRRFCGPASSRAYAPKFTGFATSSMARIKNP